MKNKIEKYQKIIESENLLEDGLLESIKAYFVGIAEAIIETPILMIKGLFNISEFSDNKKINLKDEIAISKRKGLLIEIQKNIEDIIGEYYT